MPNSPALYCLIYRSQAAHALHDGALAALLHKARLHNQQARLSGMLLFAKEEFLQVLEGAEPALSDLYARIRADPRHHSVRTLAYGPVEARSFPDWRMGFAMTDAAFVAQVTGFLPLVTAPGLAVRPPTAVSQLLRDFAQGRAQDQ